MVKSENIRHNQNERLKSEKVLVLRFRNIRTFYFAYNSECIMSKCMIKYTSVAVKRGIAIRESEGVSAEQNEAGTRKNTRG